MSTSSNRLGVFICYSHRDQRYLNELLDHLIPSIRDRHIEVWSDKRLKAGDAWRDEIRRAIATARVAVILVSAPFRASPFIAEQELPPLLSAAKTDGLTIIPVIVGSCDFHDSELAGFQAINNPAKPLSHLRPGQRDDIWVQVTKHIRELMSVSDAPQTEMQPVTLFVDEHPSQGIAMSPASHLSEAHMLNFQLRFEEAAALLAPIAQQDTSNFVAWFEYTYALVALNRPTAYGAFARAFNNSDPRRHQLHYSDIVFEAGLSHSLFAGTGPGRWVHNLSRTPEMVYSLSESGNRAIFYPATGDEDVADPMYVRLPGYGEERWIGLATISEVLGDSTGTGL